MYNLASIEATTKNGFSGSFVKPLYSSYCFAMIPKTVECLLGDDSFGLPSDCIERREEGYDAVVVFLIDGFGWSFFKEHKELCPLLKTMEESGIISRITSQFPSTTAAHVTTIHTGCEVGRTGVYEWYYYEPIIDKLIAPLPYQVAGDKLAGSLDRLVASPFAILPRKTLYQSLKAKNIESFVLQHHTISNSTYSLAMTRGAHILSYCHFEEGLASAVEVLKTKSSKKKYFFIYFPDIDAAGHRHGTKSLEVKKTITDCMEKLDKYFYTPLASRHKNIATLITADHGMVDVNPKNTYYINKKLPQISSFLQKSPRNELKVPSGSCRDFFLHIQPTKLHEALQLLDKELSGIAQCFLVEDLIERGFFGRYAQRQKIIDKLGNIVILPFAGQSVWWYQKGRFEQNFYGAHGGLTPEEMETPLFFLAL